MNEFTIQQVAIMTRHRALGYIHAADQIKPAQGTYEPKYFLFCHAIELTLKAYLLVNGHSEADCRKLSHDLAEALKLAKTHELVLSEKDEGIIVGLSREHNRPFSFRYFSKDGWAAASFENVSACCRTLILAVQGEIFAANGLPLRADHLALNI
jgi:hypothetical protein